MTKLQFNVIVRNTEVQNLILFQIPHTSKSQMFLALIESESYSVWAALKIRRLRTETDVRWYNTHIHRLEKLIRRYIKRSPSRLEQKNPWIAFTNQGLSFYQFDFEPDFWEKQQIKFFLLNTPHPCCFAVQLGLPSTVHRLKAAQTQDKLLALVGLPHKKSSAAAEL